MLHYILALFVFSLTAAIAWADPNAGSMDAANSAPVGNGGPLRRNVPTNPETELQRSTATEIQFPVGTANLTAESREKINSLLVDAHKRGQIDQVKVIAWGDVAYPSQTAAMASKKEKELAKQRGAEIEKYIEGQRETIYVEAYNMAERPTALQDLLNTSDARLKGALEKAGLVGGESGKGSRAMVMVIVR